MPPIPMLRSKSSKSLLKTGKQPKSLPVNYSGYISGHKKINKVFKRESLPDFVLIFIALGTSLVLAVMLLTLEYFPVAKAATLLVSNCRGENSFYLPTALYAEEQNFYSDNAKSFSFLSSGGSWMRVITDFEVIKNQKKTYFIITLKSVSGYKIDFSDIKVTINFSDGVSQDLTQEREDINGSTGLITIKGERNINNQDLSADLLIEGGGDGSCQGKIPNAILISPAYQTLKAAQIKNIKVVKGNQSGDYSFPKGYTPIGFSSWRYLKPFTDKGLTVFKYDCATRGWILNPQNKAYFGEPGIGYLIYNPSNITVKVSSPVPYYVPPTVDNHKVSKGWNFLYNDTGNDTFARNITLTFLAKNMEPKRSYHKNKITLQELIESGKADSKILYLLKNYPVDSGFETVNISKNNFKAVIPDAAFFWVYIFEDGIAQKTTDIPFSVEIKGGNDSFSRNQFIQFEVEIKNESNEEVVLPDASQQDPCLTGLEFYDADGKKIESDLDEKECPLWPKTINLKRGGSISYNYSWKPGKKVSGEVIVKAYFDYTRLGGPDMLYNESKVNIK